MIYRNISQKYTNAIEATQTCWLICQSLLNSQSYVLQPEAGVRCLRFVWNTSAIGQAGVAYILPIIALPNYRRSCVLSTCLSMSTPIFYA